MKPCPKHTTPVLFLWGFDNEGNPYMDARLIPEKTEACAKAFVMVEMRSRYNSHLRWGLLHVPKGCGIEDVETYIKSGSLHELREEVVAKLKQSEVRLSQIMRKPSDSGAIEFILSLEEDDDCICGEHSE
jgi:hypothetical protein